jgi:SAM-dependent methyltransferase
MSSTIDPLDTHIRDAVASRYSVIGQDPAAEVVIPVGRSWAERLGYPASLIESVPVSALASFTGIGAPALIADLAPGDQVLDLGCGAGLDTVIIARWVAPHGHVHAVDLAPGMIAAARESVRAAGVHNVTVWQAFAEHLPLPDASIDVAVVNGLFNLAPDKIAVASELGRVIRPAGRLLGAEIVITDDRLPQSFDPESWFR